MGDSTELKEDIDLEEAVREEEPEGIAMELLREFKERNKRDFELLKFTIKSFAISVVLIVAMFLVIFLYVASNFEFESYSQDGNGYNNINTGIQGDVYNGTEIPEGEEEGQ